MKSLRFLFLLAFLSVPALASAQTHPCEKPTPPFPYTVTVNVPFPLGGCHTHQERGGAPTVLTGWKFYRNGILIPLVFTQDPTPSASGLYLWHSTYTETTPTTAGDVITYELAAVNTYGDSERSYATVVVAGSGPTPVVTAGDVPARPNGYVLIGP